MVSEESEEQYYDFKHVNSTETGKYNKSKKKKKKKKNFLEKQRIRKWESQFY